MKLLLGKIGPGVENQLKIIRRGSIFEQAVHGGAMCLEQDC